MVDGHVRVIGKAGARSVISGLGVINSAIGTVIVHTDLTLTAVTIRNAGALPSGKDSP